MKTSADGDPRVCARALFYLSLARYPRLTHQTVNSVVHDLIDMFSITQIVLASTSLLLQPVSSFLAFPHVARSGLSPFSQSCRHKIQVSLMTEYAPETVQAAWDNHLSAFGSQDVSLKETTARHSSS